MKKLLASVCGLMLASSAIAAETKNPKAVIHTDVGDITIELYRDKAPKTVENFIQLAKGTKTWTHPQTREVMTGKPLYDNVKFHRTKKGFMIQGGDPSGTGGGDVGFTIPGEPNDLKFDRPGRVAMANKGGDPSSASSQFFITDSPTPFLDPSPSGTYVIFGQVVDGMKVVDEIASRPSQPGSFTAMNPATIKNVEILEAGSGEAAAKATTGTATTAGDKETTK